MEIKILLVDDDIERAEAFSRSLETSRYSVSHVCSPRSGLLSAVDSIKPDLIVIDIESPSRDILESVNVMSDYNPKPVVMFSGEQDRKMIDASVQSGVTAYMSNDINLGAVRPILDAAIAQFSQFQKLKQELQDTKAQLESRKIIERAKLLMIKEQNLTEEEAHRKLTKMAMDSGQKIDAAALMLVTFFENGGNQ